MKHTNELPLRHLIEALDGPTSGPNSYSGQICKVLNTVDEMEFNQNFVPITNGPDLVDLPSDIVADLSDDQKYSYRITKMIIVQC